MNQHIAKILPILTIAALLAGCAGAGKNSKSAVKQPGADTIKEEVVRKISDRVIGGIPITGRLQEIKKRGILRVALPPEETPFQSLDPNLKLPIGFNPALVAEIALILDAKPNITILDRTPDLPSYPPRWKDDYDLIFLPGSQAGCPKNQSFPYFYTKTPPGWKIICAAGDDGAFPSAVGEILTYLNETGIFAQLYRTYVGK
jgi:ABC-type amino acid transport substrate-binding protein